MSPLDFDKLPRFKKAAFEIVGMLQVWADAFGVERAAIERQIPIAHAWCDSNARRAPKKNMVRFLFNWMTHAQRFHNLVSKPVDNTYKENPFERDMSFEEMQEIRHRNMRHYT